MSYFLNYHPLRKNVSLIYVYSLQWQSSFVSAILFNTRFTDEAGPKML